MSYTPTTDFLALLRGTSGGERVASVPGLDYVVAALARAGLFALFVSQTAPSANQATTVWFKPATPSWTAEGIVFLWNSFTGHYEVATAALWSALFTSAVSGYNFQSVPGAAAAVASLTSLVAIQRAVPGATTLNLPAVGSQLGKALQIADWSTGVVAHTITLTPSGAEKIMQLASWQLLSTANQLAGITLYPSTDLSGWVIAP